MFSRNMVSRFWARRCESLRLFLPRVGIKIANDPSEISLADALLLYLIGDASISAQLPTSDLHDLEPRFKKAAIKLAQIAEELHAVNWTSKLRSIHPIPLPILNDKVLEIVFIALLENKQLEALYQADGKRAKRMRLHPLGLIQRGQEIYIVAMAFSYKNIRIYALDRLLEASSTNEATRVPEKFDLDTYILTNPALKYPLKKDGHRQRPDTACENT